MYKGWLPVIGKQITLPTKLAYAHLLKSCENSGSDSILLDYVHSIQYSCHSLDLVVRIYPILFVVFHFNSFLANWGHHIRIRLLE